MLRIRTSTLESFRRVTEGIGDENELIEYVRMFQQGRPNWKMLAGTAWHSVLENHLSRATGERQIRSGDFWFLREHVEAARATIGPGSHEVTAVKRFRLTSGDEVEIKGAADHLWGLRVTDNKTKFSTPDAKDYERSLQWRFYLHLHECWEFRYVLWPMKDPDGGESGLVEPKGDPLLFSFYRYPGMEAELTEWIEEFLHWANALKLTPHLELT